MTLPEPYRAFVAEAGNGCSLGPAEDGGLQSGGGEPGRVEFGVGPGRVRHDRAAGTLH